jgi:small-conductance mechanosensitive channel
VLDAPWFYWAVGVSIGFPICLLLLTELHGALRRRGSFLAGPVHVVRNPATARRPADLACRSHADFGEATPVVSWRRCSDSSCWCCCSGTNATLFQGAPEGTWRKRIPAIFLDVVRFALIAVGVGLILSYIWGAHIGGLFTALGVSSIVLGLTLQNSVGQIISGLFVLFEQPFQLGDWIETPTAKGRVVEVNWRATHINTGGGLLVMPNSVLAAASFTTSRGARRPLP